MRLIAGALLTATFSVGCAVGDEDKTKPFDPNLEKVVCSAAFSLTGTWTAGTPTRDLNEASPTYTPDGCWGVGTWTFTAALDRAAEVRDITGDKVGDRCGEYNGTAEPRVEPSYSFRVEHVDAIDNGVVVGYDNKITMLAGQSSMEIIKIKLGDDGAGDCEANLELRSADRMMEWIFKPSQTDADGKIIGVGEFVQFSEPQ
jgi:hypothetical protein